MTFSLRSAAGGDADFLTEMLVEAADWRHDGPSDPRRVSRVLADEKVAAYIAGWPREGDIGLIAEDDTPRPIGAVWLRLFDAENAGYGFVAPEVPELGIGVARAWRGRGVGRALLRGILTAAARRGHSRVSLSVDHTNPALGMYRAAGFGVHETRDNAVTMVKDLTNDR